MLVMYMYNNAWAADCLNTTSGFERVDYGNLYNSVFSLREQHGSV